MQITTQLQSAIQDGAAKTTAAILAAAAPFRVLLAQASDNTDAFGQAARDALGAYDDAMEAALSQVRPPAPERPFADTAGSS